MRLSKEAIEINQQLAIIWKAIKTADEEIQHYIQQQGGEAISYASYFDKRFPAFLEMIRGIDQGFKQLSEIEGYQNEVS